MSLSHLWNIFISNYPLFLRGAGVTIYISVIGTIVGLLIGMIMGIIRTIPHPEKGVKRFFLKTIHLITTCYVELFRGTPMIVQAMVFYYGSALAFGWDLDRIAAAIFIVSINTGAYMTEIVRGGIVSIDKGQFEGAAAIGMSHWQTMRIVVIPQVWRNILPATGNEFVINIKDTSVLSVISVTELFFQTKTVAGINFDYFGPYTVASIMYLVMTLTITRILRRLERKLAGSDVYQLVGGNQNQVQNIDKSKGVQ
ncbi:L-cystine transport system permease protein YecS [Jeotgalibaca dankookensis]|uniref:L-cystine transport system permease protein YecS n=1 Tax=Jeotgalibaca dankookensis TaxID=708126 RepID=A0A1S6INT8_9LACT|nr:amino acid ABC transporter permease [Jeotgalibaca dankookensis]AQS53217.1 L-cystine transport system permease protein YecS [Jeotgalibaca dankookensis]